MPSEATANAVLAAGVGIADDRLVVVGEGADHLGEPDEPAAQALLERLGVLGPYLLTVSTLEPRKNLERLLEAYTLARPKLPEPWPLVVVGPSGWGPSPSPAALGPTAGVVFAGTVEGGVLAAVYRRARLCAYVPIVEGFGLPVVESMAQGTPVVSSPVPSSGGASLEVDPTDVSSIAEGLVVAAGDEMTRTALVARGLARAAALRWVETAACARGGLGASGRRGAGPAMTAASPSGALAVALDVSAVPRQPVGAGRYVVELARALAGRADCRLTLLARRDDGPRWALMAPGERVVTVAPPAARRAFCTSRRVSARWSRAWTRHRWQCTTVLTTPCPGGPRSPVS